MGLLKSVVKGVANVALSVMESSVNSGLSNQREKGIIDNKEYYAKRDEFKKNTDKLKQANKEW